MAESNILEMATDVVAAFVANNSVAADALPALIKSVYSAISTLGEAPVVEEEAVAKPTAAQIRKSIQPEHLVSFIDGRAYKTLKRHLATNGMTVDGYKAKYGLPKDYPTTAPSYSARRSEMAKSLGLGRKAGEAGPAKAGRKAKASQG